MAVEIASLHIMLDFHITSISQSLSISHPPALSLSSSQAALPVNLGYIIMDG